MRSGFSATSAEVLDDSLVWIATGVGKNAPVLHINNQGKLAKSNLEAMRWLKGMFWKGIENC